MLLLMSLCPSGREREGRCGHWPRFQQFLSIDSVAFQSCHRAVQIGQPSAECLLARLLGYNSSGKGPMLSKNRIYAVDPLCFPKHLWAFFFSFCLIASYGLRRLGILILADQGQDAGADDFSVSCLCEQEVDKKKTRCLCPRRISLFNERGHGLNLTEAGSGFRLSAFYRGIPFIGYRESVDGPKRARSFEIVTRSPFSGPRVRAGFGNQPITHDWSSVVTA